MSSPLPYKSPERRTEEFLDAEDDLREARIAARQDGLSLLLGKPKRALASIEDDHAHGIASTQDRDEVQW